MSNISTIKVIDSNGGTHIMKEISPGVVMDSQRILFAQVGPIIMGQIIHFGYTEKGRVINIERAGVDYARYKLA